MLRFTGPFKEALTKLSEQKKTRFGLLIQQELGRIGLEYANNFPESIVYLKVIQVADLNEERFVDDVDTFRSHASDVLATVQLIMMEIDPNAKIPVIESPKPSLPSDLLPQL